MTVAIILLTLAVCIDTGVRALPFNPATVAFLLAVVALLYEVVPAVMHR